MNRIIILLIFVLSIQLVSPTAQAQTPANFSPATYQDAERNNRIATTFPVAEEMIKKYADKHHLPFNVKIFASDVFPYFIQKAKKGRYSTQEVAQIPPEFLSNYFIKYPDYYEIIPEIKNQLLFTTHNLLNDPPFTKLDLICCRNFLIYIKAQEQKRVIDLLRFSLNIGGFLFLGPSEGLASLKLDLITHNPPISGKLSLLS